MLRFVLLVCLAAAVHARGAGRAFPIDSENYAIDAFQRINRFLEWDETNFLIDLSGQYANCDNVGRQGFLTVDKRTPDGVSIAAYVDDIQGSGSDVNSVNSMVQSVIDDWTRQYGSDIYRQIETADKFGCSVRPGCTGRASVACLFSPGDQGGFRPRPPNIEQGDIKARAFTEEQYDVAERVMGEVWDRNNTLENLSGWETSCAMLIDDEFHIAHAKEAALQRGMDVEYLYGTARNRGETEPAMVEILKGMKKLYGAKKVGCSIIPDCMAGQEMYVVVGCLFEV